MQRKKFEIIFIMSYLLIYYLINLLCQLTLCYIKYDSILIIHANVMFQNNMKQIKLFEISLMHKQANYEFFFS